MTARPVVLAADDLVTAGWALAEAERLHAPVQVVGTGDDVGRTRTTRRLRRSSPHVPVTTRRVADPLGADLRRISATAELVVVTAAAGHPALDEAACPVATVPRTVPPAGRVIVGVAPWTAPAVLDIAVREAVARDSELVAVRVWGGPDSDLGRLLPDTLAKWDLALSRVRRDLEKTLTPWRTENTGGRIRLLTVRDDPAPLLVALAADAELLVLGRSVRGTTAGTVAGAPVGDMVATVRCPLIMGPDVPTPHSDPGLRRVRSGPTTSGPVDGAADTRRRGTPV